MLAWWQPTVVHAQPSFTASQASPGGAKCGGLTCLTQRASSMVSGGPVTLKGAPLAALPVCNPLALVTGKEDGVAPASLWLKN